MASSQVEELRRELRRELAGREKALLEAQGLTESLRVAHRSLESNFQQSTAELREASYEQVNQLRQEVKRLKLLLRAAKTELEACAAREKNRSNEILQDKTTLAGLEDSLAQTEADNRVLARTVQKMMRQDSVRQSPLPLSYSNPVTSPISKQNTKIPPAHQSLKKSLDNNIPSSTATTRSLSRSFSPTKSSSLFSQSRQNVSSLSSLSGINSPRSIVARKLSASSNRSFGVGKALDRSATGSRDESIQGNDEAFYQTMNTVFKITNELGEGI